MICLGEGVARLPIHRLSVIDISACESGIVNNLLDELMRVEKPEYESQSRSIDHDIINHQYDLNDEHVSSNCYISNILSIKSSDIEWAFP